MTTTAYGEGTVELRIDDDGVAHLRLNNPEKRNALSDDVCVGIIDALADLEGRTDVRCVVVSGDGDAFSAGGDISRMVERHEGDDSLDSSVRHVIQKTGRCVKRLAECEFPTVSKIDGPAFGAGANLAIAADVQVMSADARIGFGFRQVGLAVDSGTSWMLPRLVGDNVARELVFTGELLDAERAEELGVVNHVYPAEEFDERAEELVARIAEGPTVALRTSKRLFNHGWTSTLDEAIEHEAAAQAAVFESADHAEGFRAFTERRDPEFEGK